MGNKLHLPCWEPNSRPSSLYESSIQSSTSYEIVDARYSQTYHLNESSLNSIQIPGPYMTDPKEKDGVRKPSLDSKASETFSWGRMQSICLEHRKQTQRDSLSLPVMRNTYKIFELLKQHMSDVCYDLFEEHEISTKQDAGIYTKMVTKYAECINLTDPRMIRDKFVAHFVVMIHLHIVILNNFINGKRDMAFEILKQIVIFHGLLQINATHFRTLDLYIVRYLSKTKIVNEESLHSIIIYLNMITSYITQFLVTQSTRYKLVSMLKLPAVTTDKENHRLNLARENYRLMKKWREHAKILKTKLRGSMDEIFMDAAIRHANSRRKEEEEEDDVSITTSMLKEQDCLMSCFTRRK